MSYLRSLSCKTHCFTVNYEPQHVGRVLVCSRNTLLRGPSGNEWQAAWDIADEIQPLIHVLSPGRLLSRRKCCIEYRQSAPTLHSGSGKYLALNTLYVHCMEEKPVVGHCRTSHELSFSLPAESTGVPIQLMDILNSYSHSVSGAESGCSFCGNGH